MQQQMRIIHLRGLLRGRTAGRCPKNRLLTGVCHGKIQGRGVVRVLNRPIRAFIPAIPHEVIRDTIARLPQWRSKPLKALIERTIRA